MPLRIRPGDQALDAAFAFRPHTDEEVTVEEAERLAKESPPFVKKELPTGKKELDKFAEQIVAWYPEGTAFYHPGLKANVIKQDGNIVVITVDPVDEEAWVKGGMKGTALPLAVLDTTNTQTLTSSSPEPTADRPKE